MAYPIEKQKILYASAKFLERSSCNQTHTTPWSLTVPMQQANGCQSAGVVFKTL